MICKTILAALTVLGASSYSRCQITSQDSNYSDRTVYEPVNTNATPEAKKLLAYLYSIRGRRIISGIHIFNDSHDKYIYSDYIKALTKKSPELYGYDFIDYYRPAYASQLIQEVYSKYLAGHIITLMWHEGRPLDDPPFDWETSIQGKLTDKEWEDLITPGTRLYDRWLSDVDTIAGYLKALQNLGVPVLWRPYDEMNGVWFWWGNRKGPDGSSKLYRMMFDRYVNHFHLNNLLWVWGPNAPRKVPDHEAYDYEDFFPGLDYVDVLGADVYHNDYKQSHYDRLLELAKGKVIALTEVGEAPTSEILMSQSDWTYFMIWGDFAHTSNNPDNIRELFESRSVISHEDSP